MRQWCGGKRRNKSDANLQSEDKCYRNEITTWYLTKPPRLTQPGHPSAGRRNEYWRWLRPPLWKKRRVLRSSRPCYQDCWVLAHWPSRLKALAVNGAGHLADLGCSLIGFNPRRLKVPQRGWAPTQRTCSVYAKSSSSSSYYPIGEFTIGHRWRRLSMTSIYFDRQQMMKSFT